MAYVLLVNPSKVQYSREEGDISGTEVSPPLGLMLLGAVLRGKGHEVRIFDRQATVGDRDLPRELDQYAKILRERVRPDLVGITCVTPFRSDARAFIAKTREVDSHLKIVVGGPDAAFASKEYLVPGCADIAALGEGESTVVALADGIAPSRVPGIAYMENGEIRQTEKADAAVLDELPFPARDLVQLDRYPKEAASMISSRGCSYQCVFCCSRAFWGPEFRTYSAKKLADEIELLHRQYGYHMIRHHDDNWAYRPADFLCKLHDELAERGLINLVTHEVETSPITLNETKVRLMKQIGVSAVWISMETGQPHLLQYLKKPYCLEDVERAVKLLREAHIDVGLYVIFGMPDETYKQAKETVDRVLAFGPAYVGASILTAYPGTPLSKTEPSGEDFGSLFASLAGWAHWGDYLGRNMTDYELLKVFAYAYSKLGNRLGNSYRLSKMFQFDRGLEEGIADTKQPWKKRLEKWLLLKSRLRTEPRDSMRAALEVTYEDLGHRVANEPVDNRFRQIVRAEFRADVIRRGEFVREGTTMTFLDLREKAYRNLVTRVAATEYFADVKGPLIEYRDAVVTGQEKSQMRLFGEVVGGLWPQNTGRDAVMQLLGGGLRSEYYLTGLGFRKHFLHQFQVFLLGSYIIAELQDSMGRSAEADRLGLTSTSLYRTWLMASALHDIGLCAGMRPDLDRDLEQIARDLGFQNSAEREEPELDYVRLRMVEIGGRNGNSQTIDLLSLLQSWFRRSDILREGALEQAFERGDHGVLGAMVVLRILMPTLAESYDLTTTGPTLLIDEERELGSAVAAVAVHSLATDCFARQICFKDYPAVFLLRLTDELDEERRAIGDLTATPELYLSAIRQRIENSTKEIELVLKPRVDLTDYGSMSNKEIEDRVEKQCKSARKWLRIGNLTDSELPGCVHSVCVVATLALERPCELLRMPVIRCKKDSPQS